MGTNDERSSSAAYEKQQHDDRSTSSARGWLNWLSLGMLGAGGTSDSSSFAGVVSEEIIKVICNQDFIFLLGIFSSSVLNRGFPMQDIYAATEFNPVGSFDEDSFRREKFLNCVRLSICQIGVAIFSKY